MNRIILCSLASAVLQSTAPNVFAQDQASPKTIYELSCVGCHGTGVLGAPKLGDAAQWTPRTKAGIDALVRSAIAGTDKGMPPKGGRPDLSPAQLCDVIEYMMTGITPPAKAGAAANPTIDNNAVAAKVEVKPSAPLGTTATTNSIPAPTATTRVTVVPPPSNDVNVFNRLLRPSGRANRPAVDSGIHDPTNDMTLELQSPSTAFAGLSKSVAGNHIDWVKSLNNKAIVPRWDRLNPAAPPLVMDLNIVREVKGSMPDVIFPHKQHTEWLDCSNCHPAIFVPQKGANQISMASILLGQKCGVCHGKVAFPVSECRLCHSRKKADTAMTTERKP